MLLGNLLKSTNKKYQKIYVSGISFDSRKVKKNDIFFAIPGVKRNGEKFIGEAINRGASVIVSKKKFDNQTKSRNFVPKILLPFIAKNISFFLTFLLSKQMPPTYFLL